MTNMSKVAENIIQSAINRAESIRIDGVNIAAWCDFGGVDETSAPIVIKVYLEESDEFEQFPSKRDRIESVVCELWKLGIYAVDNESQLGRYIELFDDSINESASSIKLIGCVCINKEAC